MSPIILQPSRIQKRDSVRSVEKSSPSGAQILLDLEDMTKTNVEKLEKLATEIKKVREMIQSSLLNDDAYREATDDLKSLTKQRASIQYKILNMPENKKLVEHLKEMKLEKKELSAAQSDYLREYQRMSGTTQLELFDGSVLEIVATYKLVKAGGK